MDGGPEGVPAALRTGRRVLADVMQRCSDAAPTVHGRPVSVREPQRLFTMDWLLTYADCDPAGIIYYASAFEIIERVYMAYAVEHHVTPDELRAAGVPVPVARSASGDFFSPMDVLDRIRCDLYCDGVGRSSIDWRCTFTRLVDTDGGPAFEGHLRQVYVAGGRPAPVPDLVRRLVGA